MHRAMSIVALATLAVPLRAMAWLGGDAASVETDRRHMQATVVTSTAPAYTRYDLHTPVGTRLTQYLSPSGRVFAIAWQGPVLPDLKQALGDYFPRYVSAADVRGPGRRVVDEPGLVVQAAGHMRAFVGRAFIPEALPAGVRLEDLR